VQLDICLATHILLRQLADRKSVFDQTPASGTVPRQWYAGRLSTARPPNHCLCGSDVVRSIVRQSRVLVGLAYYCTARGILPLSLPPKTCFWRMPPGEGEWRLKPGDLLKVEASIRRAERGLQLWQDRRGVTVQFPAEDFPHHQ